LGGDSPKQVGALEARFLRRLHGAPCRYLKGRKQSKVTRLPRDNGCVERTHRTDAEEPYRPYLPQAASDGGFLVLAARAATCRMCSGLASEMEWRKGLIFEPYIIQAIMRLTVPLSCHACFLKDPALTCSLLPPQEW